VIILVNATVVSLIVIAVLYMMCHSASPSWCIPTIKKLNLLHPVVVSLIRMCCSAANHVMHSHYTLIVYSSTLLSLGVVEHCTGTFLLSLDALVLQWLHKTPVWAVVMAKAITTLYVPDFCNDTVASRPRFPKVQCSPKLWAYTSSVKSYSHILLFYNNCCKSKLLWRYCDI
jgi:hypothetical protein